MKIKTRYINKYFGFSMIEIIISLIIVGIIGVAAIPTITRAKGISKASSIRGQYACYRPENGSLTQYIIDEKTAVVKKIPNSDSCSLKFKRMPASIYVIAQGARINGIEPQVKTYKFDKVPNELQIKIGDKKSPTSSITAITSGDEIEDSKDGKLNLVKEIVKVEGSQGGGHILSNGIINNNLTSCRLINKNACSTDQTNEPCEIVKDEKGNAKAIKINCDIDLSPDEINLATLIPKKNSFIKFSASDKIYEANGNLIAFTYKDSDYNANKIVSSATPSTLTKYLRNIPMIRKSKLTEELVQIYSDSKKDTAGLIYILW